MKTISPSVLNERRSSRRFPIELDLLYRATGRRNRRYAGAGKTTNISSSGILFRTEDPLEPDINIEASIAWPVSLQSNVPLKLRVRGRVVRTEPGAAVVAIQQYAFHTAAKAG
ncbi:MAG TPA: PilZ domain-containing protein [Bryobacteraceae bacterium]|jgi:hypothetical protein|nr:PilZ domain-containing protein [Bryobacteraceae bacterium]